MSNIGLYNPPNDNVSATDNNEIPPEICDETLLPKLNNNNQNKTMNISAQIAASVFEQRNNNSLENNNNNTMDFQTLEIQNEMRKEANYYNRQKDNEEFG